MDIEDESKIKILKTISNRLNTDVTVKVSLSTILGKSGSENFDKLRALTAVLQHAEETTAKLARAAVYRTLRRYLNDEESIGRVMSEKGFTMQELQDDLEKVKEHLEVNDLQATPQLPELEDLTGEEYLVLDDDGFKKVPGVKLEEFELPPFMKGGDLTFDDDGNLHTIPPEDIG